MSLPLAAVMPFALERPWVAIAIAVVAAGLSWAIARRSHAEGSRARFVASLACRCALLGLLALALGGLQWQRERPEVAVAFAVDSSDSVRGSRDAALRDIEAAAALASAGDRGAIVQFGRDALIERGLSEDLRGLALASTPAPDGSDISSGLRLARGLLPPDGRRRIVLLTDGESSGEDPAGTIARLMDEGVDVVIAPLGTRDEDEVLVDSISAPARVHESEPFEVRVVLRASASASGTLTITRDGELIGQARADVTAGAPAAFRFMDRSDAAGAHLYRAHFAAEPDGFEQNNAADALVRVEGRPRLLVVDPDPPRLASVLALLRSAGLTVEAVPPERLPRTVAEASRHAGIVLSDLDSVSVTLRQMEALRSYVREAGGGLLMAGGPDAFGPGGWYSTPVEDVLPVDMDVRNQKYYPSLALVLVIDKSGSMAGMDGVSKLDLAKEAARQTASLLFHGDRLGVIAFDSAAKVVVDPDLPLDPVDAARLIGSIRPGGGTDIYPALVVAQEKLVAGTTMLKHVILLSDGQSPGRDYMALITKMREQRITTSTVAVGSDADLATMQQFATWGGGRYYFTADAASIPRIFTKEAFTTARSFVVEETFAPVPGMPHPVTRGALPLPAVLGHVATSAKPAAEVALLTHREDPLLALRSFGLGRSAALTTDIGQRWSGAWLTSSAGRTLLAQLMRWLAARSESSLLEARLERRAGRVVVAVEARDESGAFLNFGDFRAGVAGPDQGRQDLRLRQVAPGRYEGEVADAGAGAYFAAVSQHDGDRVLRSTGAAEVFAYSDEYRSLKPPGDALERIALASGARVERDPARWFDRDGVPARSLRPAWRDVVLAAAILLLLDVALRRVMLPERWFARVMARVRRAFGRPEPVAVSEPLSRLRAVKERTREAGGPLAAPPPVAVRPDPADADVPGPPSPPARPAPRPAEASPATPPPPPVGDSQPSDDAQAAGFSSRLLAAKRRARSDKDAR